MSSRGRAIGDLHLPPAQQPAYQRHQVEQAIWRCEGAPARGKPAKLFTTRIHHLLVIDRGEPPLMGRVYAFSEEPPGGRGEHALFSVQDAFHLWTALALQDFGLSRHEAVSLMRRQRLVNDETILGMLEDPANATPEADEIRDPSQVPAAQQAFLLLTSRHAGSWGAATGADFWMHAPAGLVRGRTKLFDVLRRAGLEKTILLRVDVPARRLPRLLAKAPQKRRGVQG